jgi:hypothetical protein
MIRSASLVAAGSLLGLLLPRIQQEPKAAPQDKAPATQGQDQHQPPKKTGVHSQFASLVGDYDVAIKLTQGAEKPIESKGKSKISAILDGRFLLDEQEGEMMGKPYKSMKVYGWNAEAKAFEGVWLYTESNAIMRLSGTAGQDRRSINFEGVVQETPDKKMQVAISTARNQDGTLTVKMTHAGPDGKAMGSLEQTYTKKGGK